MMFQNWDALSLALMLPWLAIGPIILPPKPNCENLFALNVCLRPFKIQTLIAPSFSESVVTFQKDTKTYGEDLVAKRNPKVWPISEKLYFVVCSCHSPRISVKAWKHCVSKAKVWGFLFRSEISNFVICSGSILKSFQIFCFRDAYNFSCPIDRVAEKYSKVFVWTPWVVFLRYRSRGDLLPFACNILISSLKFQDVGWILMNVQNETRVLCKYYTNFATKNTVL
jgi:hypothetical protein